MSISVSDLAGKLPVDHPLLFAAISGAHLYGFPSPDSDVDVRGSFVLPLDALLSLKSVEETVTRTYQHEGREVDFVAHDVRKFVQLMLRHNGYVLEQLYSPLVVQGHAAFDELRKLGRSCIVRHLVHHYRGFARNQMELLQKQQPPRLKDLLYVYRVLLTGIHVLETGEVESNLRNLNENFRLPDIDDLIARKIAEGAQLATEEVEAHHTRIDELFARLDSAFEKSALPERATNFEALNDFVIRIRKEMDS
ncbi:MAG: nucleotidyltransferase domain-containing protein [bacterium]